MNGELQGGWEYIIAAYAVTWLFFGGYAVSLWLRGVPKTPEADAGNYQANTRGSRQ